MKVPSEGDPGAIRVTSADEVRHFAGPVSDHTIVEILATQPSVQDLEVAVIFARGEGDHVDRLGHSLSGVAAQVYDILSRDALYVANEE